MTNEWDFLRTDKEKVESINLIKQNLIYNFANASKNFLSYVKEWLETPLRDGLIKFNVGDKIIKQNGEGIHFVGVILKSKNKEIVFNPSESINYNENYGEIEVSITPQYGTLKGYSDTLSSIKYNGEDGLLYLCENTKEPDFLTRENFVEFIKKILISN